MSLIDESDEYHLPGKPLDEREINELTESSRNSGIISDGGCVQFA
ncbi:hypothetical protein [Segetibacter aerophilus]|nr:hypothetical protein [Segetibacter aerophilus]